MHHETVQLLLPPETVTVSGLVVRAAANVQVLASRSLRFLMGFTQFHEEDPSGFSGVSVTFGKLPEKQVE